MSEHLDCPPLVRSDGNGMGVFLDCCTGNFVGAPIVTQVDHLAALALQNPSENTYRCIMAIENGSGRDYPQRLTVPFGPFIGRRGL